MLKKLIISLAAVAFVFASAESVLAKDKFNKKIVKAAQKEGEVVVYHSLNRKAVKAVAKAYQKKFKIKVNLTRKGTGGVIKMISAEGLAGGLRCDVVSVGELGIFLKWKADGLLVPYKTVNYDKIMKQYRDPEHYATTVRQNFYGIGYSTKKVKPGEVPKDWKDILNPKWKGKIGVISPRSAGPARLWLAGMIRLYGWDYIKQLSKLEPLMIKGSSTAAKLLVRGEVSFTLPGSEHGILKRQVKGKSVGLVYPKSGILGKHSPAGICKGSKNINAAKLWIDFETSKQGQKIINKKHALIPIRGDVKASRKRPAGAFDKVIRVSAKHLKEKGTAERKKFERIMKAEMGK